MPTYSAHHLRHIADHRRRRVQALQAEEPVRIRPLPTKPEEMSWRDYVIMLLHIGGELEHGLMVQYLYAAYSLGGDHLSEEEQKEVQEWQELILTVAREEMGHLLTVQNLLCLLGGPVSFDRENYPWDSPFYPFPFNFEPLTRQSLARYIFAEMPGNFESLEKLYADPHGDVADAWFRDFDIPFIEETVRGCIEDTNARPVGEVYQLIHDIIADPNLIPDDEFRADTYQQQASWDDWGRGYRPDPESPHPPGQSGVKRKLPKPKTDVDEPKVDQKAEIIIERVGTRTEALYAIREIAAQGENPSLHAKDGTEISHFERFVSVLQRYDRKVFENPDWSPARKVPTNPTTRTATDNEREGIGTTLIECAASAKWADLFDCRYRALLSYLTHTFRLARLVDPNVPNVRGAVMARIFGEMYNLKAIAGILVRMPLTDDPDDERRAGPPFQMPYTLVLPTDQIDCWRLHRDIVDNSRSLCRALLDPENDFLAKSPPEAERYLKTLGNADVKALDWIETVLSGLENNGGHHS